MNHDAMNHAPLKAVANTAMAIIDSIQDEPAEVQIPAITAAFRLLIERFGLDPQDAFTVADNIMNHADGRRVEFDAIRAYLESEV